MTSPDLTRLDSTHSASNRHSLLSDFPGKHLWIFCLVLPHHCHDIRCGHLGFAPANLTRVDAACLAIPATRDHPSGKIITYMKSNKIIIIITNLLAVLYSIKKISSHLKKNKIVNKVLLAWMKCNTKNRQHNAIQYNSIVSL